MGIIRPKPNLPKTNCCGQVGPNPSKDVGSGRGIRDSRLPGMRSTSPNHEMLQFQRGFRMLAENCGGVYVSHFRKIDIDAAILLLLFQ